MNPYNLVSFLAWAVLLLIYLAICVAGMVKLWRAAPDEDVLIPESNPFMVLGGSVWCGTCDPPPPAVLERLQPGTLEKRRARRAARRAA